MKKSSKNITYKGTSLNVEYDYFPFRRGMRDSLGGVRGAGPPLEPDEPASVDINAITSTENLYELFTEEDIERIGELVMQELYERAHDGYE